MVAEYALRSEGLQMLTFWEHVVQISSQQALAATPPDNKNPIAPNPHLMDSLGRLMVGRGTPVRQDA